MQSCPYLSIKYTRSIGWLDREIFRWKWYPDRCCHRPGLRPKIGPSLVTAYNNASTTPSNLIISCNRIFESSLCWRDSQFPNLASYPSSFRKFYPRDALSVGMHGRTTQCQAHAWIRKEGWQQAVKLIAKAKLTDAICFAWVPDLCTAKIASKGQHGAFWTLLDHLITKGSKII